MNQNNQPEAMGAFFNARAGGYDTHMGASLADAETYYRALAAPFAPSTAPLEILDLGCGTGLEIPAVLEKAPNAQLTCIDLSAEMLRILQEKFPLENLQVIQGSYLTHSFGEARYDAALSSMTLHHLLPGQKTALYARLCRALKPGGLYVEGDYIVPEEKMNRLLAEYRALPEVAKGGTHHIDIPLSLDMQQDLLHQAGFTEVRKIYARGESLILAARKG